MSMAYDLGMMVSKGNHPMVELLSLGDLLWIVKKYDSLSIFIQIWFYQNFGVWKPAWHRPMGLCFRRLQKASSVQSLCRRWLRMGCKSCWSLYEFSRGCWISLVCTTGIEPPGGMSSLQVRTVNRSQMAILSTRGTWMDHLGDLMSPAIFGVQRRGFHRFSARSCTWQVGHVECRSSYLCATGIGLSMVWRSCDIPLRNWELFGELWYSSVMRKAAHEV